MAEVTIAYAVCPMCDQRINLFHMKDFESYSHIEVQRHYQARHPEVLERYKGFGMPYTPVEFEIVQVLRDEAQAG